jgi:cell division septum initiation protein DivIVA
LTGDKNHLLLYGRALPYRPLPFAGKMRAEFTRYPGNPIATIQMIGPDEGTTTINGMWKDRFIKTTSDLGAPVFGQPGIATYNGATVANVFDLVQLVDGFRRRGQLLEVGWDEIVRHGIIRTFTQRWLRREDVEWELEFEWASQGENELPVGFSVTPPIVDIINGIIDSVNELTDAIAIIQAAYSTIASWMNTISNALDAIQEAAGALVDLATQAVNGVLAPLALAKKLTSTVQTIIDKAKEIDDTIASLPARASRYVQDISSLTQAEALESERLNRQARRAARKTRAESARKRQEMQANSQEQRPLAVITAKEGQDLRDISREAYGTPDEWRRLMAYNGFITSKLTAGDQVIVPKLSEDRVAVQ